MLYLHVHVHAEPHVVDLLASYSIALVSIANVCMYATPYRLLCLYVHVYTCIYTCTCTCHGEMIHVFFIAQVCDMRSRNERRST